jgi:hypothetical protein
MRHPDPSLPIQNNMTPTVKSAWPYIHIFFLCVITFDTGEMSLGYLDQSALCSTSAVKSVDSLQCKVFRNLCSWTKIDAIKAGIWTDISTGVDVF